MLTYICAGAERFLLEVTEAGVPIGIIAGTGSSPEERVVNGALKALGDDAPHMQVFTNAVDNLGAESSDDASSGDDLVPPGSFEHSMAAARAQVRSKPICWRSAVKEGRERPLLGGCEVMRANCCACFQLCNMFV